MATACPGAMRTSPRSYTRVWSIAYWRICGPATMKTTSRSMRPMPTVMSDIATRPRLRSGRNIRKWRASARSAVATIATIVAVMRSAW
jgi:hypothetical protein